METGSDHSDVALCALQALERADAVIEKISDDGETLRIWFRFVQDPVSVTKVIDAQRAQYAKSGTPRTIVSYLRLI
ncbi:MAG: hypothetical protein WBB25_16355 [Sulfitobacter sp.]